MTTIQRVEAKQAELLEVFGGLTENQMKVAGDLISQMAFMAVTLEDLSADIAENGTVETYSNGPTQSGQKISSNAKLYSTLIAKYAQITTKLLAMIPAEGRNIDAELREQRVMLSKEFEDRLRQERKEAVSGNLDRLANLAAMEALQKGEIEQSQLPDYARTWREKYRY